MRLKRQEAKPNGSNQKVSFQFVVKIVIEEKQWQVANFFITWKCEEVVEPFEVGEQPGRIIFITFQAGVQFLVLEEEVKRTEVWTEGFAVCRARDA